MTGREWYAGSWNAAPTGPSWRIKRAPDGLLHLVPVSGQNRISFKQREEKARVAGWFFLFLFYYFLKATKVYRRPWAAFRITLIKSASGLK